MKHIPYILVFLLVVVSSCKNDDDQPVDPVDQLPPATQTGARTFACLINGKPYIDTSGSFNCFYQFVDGGFYFGIQGNKDIESTSSMTMGTYDKPIVEGETYILDSDELGNAWAIILFSLPNEPSMRSVTTLNLPSTLTITKLDYETNIISGTFSIDIRNPFNNEIVKIREGRFDTFFTE